MNRLSIFCLIIFFAACTAPEKTVYLEDEISKTIYLSKDSLTLKLDTIHTIYVGDWGLPYYNFYDLFDGSGSDTLYLYAYNPSYHQIDVFNLTDYSHSKSIKFADEGPNKVNDFDGFFNQDKNHLVFSSYINNQLVLYDLKDEKTDTRITFNDVVDSLYDNKQINIHSEPMIGVDVLSSPKNDNFYIPIYPWINEKDKEYYEKPNLALYNYDENTLVKTFSQFPSFYRDKGFFPLFNKPSTLLVDDTILVTYGYSDEIYKYSISGDFIQVIQNKPTLFKGRYQEGLSRNDPTIQEQSDFLVTNPFYLKTLYDSHRNIYYRFLKLPQELYKTDKKLNQRYTGEWKIELLDADLSKIGEKVLDGSQYNMLFSFVTKKGLCIGSFNHTKENEMKINLFEVIEHE